MCVCVCVCVYRPGHRHRQRCVYVRLTCLSARARTQQDSSYVCRYSVCARTCIHIQQRHVYTYIKDWYNIHMYDIHMMIYYTYDILYIIHRMKTCHHMMTSLYIIHIKSIYYTSEVYILVFIWRRLVMIWSLDQMYDIHVCID